MARITVSLSNELEQRLQAHAQQRDLPVSQVVAEAVLVHLDGSARPSPVPSAPMTADLEVREYLEELYGDLKLLRKCVEGIADIVSGAHPVPSRLTKPSWKKARAARKARDERRKQGAQKKT